MTGTHISDEVLHEHLDHMSPELAATFHESFRRLRSKCPVAHSDRYGGFWVVSRYEDVFRVAQDWETYSSVFGLTVPQEDIAVRNIPVEVDPPLQRVYKRLINVHLTPAAVAPWEEPTRALARRLIESFIDEGKCEFMDAFAQPFPALSFFDFAIGAPAEDLERVAYMASKASLPTDPEGPAAWVGLSQWIGEFLERRQSQAPRGDIVDGLLHAEVDGRPITWEEVIGSIQLVILGGLETTAGALGSMMVRFCEEPEIPALLRAQPQLIPEAVEEMLRLDGPFISIARTATHDTELGGKRIAKGDKVVIYFGSANRDEEVFANPDAFDLERGSQRHLAFGVGPHRCAGSNIARLNLRVALEELLSRLDDLKLQDGADIHYHSTSTRRPLSVPITFTKVPA